MNPKPTLIPVPVPVPAPESLPEPTPVPQPIAPSPKEEKPAAQDTQSVENQPVSGALSWQGILKNLSNTVDSFIYGILEDSTHADAEIVAEKVTIMAKSPFSLSLIDTEDVKNAVKTAANAVSGLTVTVTVEESSASGDDKQNKLDNLSRFDNIKFE